MNTTPASSFEHSRELALQLLASQGFGQVSLRKLAAHMGLSTAALYSHCGSKEELLFEALEEHYENILTLVSRSLRTAAAPRQHLQHISRAMAQLYRRNPWHFQLACRERHCLNAEHRKQIDQLRQRIVQHLLRLYVQPVDKHSPRQQSAGLLALNLLEQLPQWLADSALDSTEQLSLIEHLIQGALAQLSTPQGSTAPEERRYAELQRRFA